MDPIKKLTNLGQSLWYDNIQRRLLQNGGMQAMIELGEIRGVTANPTIFNNAIAKSTDYDSAIIPLAWAGWDAEKIFWQLAVEDIQAATDLFLPLFEETNGGDGYVSLEVSPDIAHDTEASIAQAQQLWARVARPNLMVKIPATAEGIPAIRKATAAGVNVNITLIFSLKRYAQVMEAYLSGLEDRLAAGHSIRSIASVASFFVSRVDSKVDPQLPEGSELRGKAAIANAKLAYDEFLKTFRGERWEKLKAQGARLQRPLWASTSTKNPDYPDLLYVDNLIGPDTVNTVPPATLDAFKDHGRAEVTLTRGVEVARRQLEELERKGISMDKVTQELEDEGVKSFSESFANLFAVIDERRKKALAQLGPLAGPVEKRITHLETQELSQRLWERDVTLWAPDSARQAEIGVRLGWLDLPGSSRLAIPDIKAFADEIHKAGLKKYLVLGMGGSSLAPEVIGHFAASKEYQLAILDSTDPAQVLAAALEYPPAQTLYIVSSKSGGTSEVMAAFEYFWELSGKDGSHFVAITDPGTSLETLAVERRFRRLFGADPNVGGRYSALTHFGLVPAALLGLDLTQLLDRASQMRKDSGGMDKGRTAVCRNPGIALGVILAEAVLHGRDKLTVLADAPLNSFGSWLEQLIAESSGKEGKGIIPVDLEPVADPALYGDDRLFVYLRRTGESDAAVSALRAAGFPVLEFHMADAYSLGAEFFRWELATAVACHILGVDAFDQPDVQDAKDRTKAKITEFQSKGSLPEKDLVLLESGGSALKEFLASARAGDYIAINAYLPRNEAMTTALTTLRTMIREQTHCATTVGFGPRFQHSTGQLHKGGPDTGLFLQIVADPVEDVKIPAQGMTFGTLERAQALGDYEALTSRGRRTLRLHLPEPSAVRELAALLQPAHG